jgi:SAM-dependent methyltransferase
MTDTELEREKYQKVWTKIPEYRCISPGEKLVGKFLTWAKWSKGDDLIDCGCGTGRASKRLADHGLRVTMMDIAPQAKDGSIDLPFIEGCLWESFTDAKYDWVYCCDVLEHIPTDRVDGVLDNLAAMTTYGAFLQIALWPEAFGRHVGEVLHLTVQPVEWWMEKIAQRWEIQRSEVSADERLIVLTGEVK